MSLAYEVIGLGFSDKSVIVQGWLLCPNTVLRKVAHGLEIGCFLTLTLELISFTFFGRSEEEISAQNAEWTIQEGTYKTRLKSILLL